MAQSKSLILLVVFVFLSGCTGGVSEDDQDRLLKINDGLLERDFEYAVPEAEAYTRDYPESPSGWCLLGWIYAKSDSLQEAQTCFDKTIALDAEWDNAYVGKGVVFRKLGDNKNAKRCYLKAIEIYPENAEAFSSLLVIEIVNGDYKKAIEYGEKSWSLRKDSATIAANLSLSYHYIGDNNKRDEYFKHAQHLKYHNLETLQDIFKTESVER